MGDEGKAVGSRACRRLCLFEPLSLTPARRFPPPWSIEELDACFVVRDHNGQQLGYVYFGDEPGRRSAAIAELPERLQRSQYLCEVK
jgi:hypothetical protein